MKPSNLMFSRMKPSNLMFSLRWKLPEIILALEGILVFGFSIYGLMTYQGDPPDAAFSSLAGMIGRPSFWAGLVIGPLMFARALYNGQFR